MASTINRADIGTNDDGTGTTGTVINIAYIALAIYDKIDAIFAGALSFVSAAFTGAVTIGTTLLVTGAATFSSTIAAIGKATFSVAPMTPGSIGTAIFGLDCTDTAVISVPTSTSVTPFSNANVFAGLIMIVETTSSGDVGLFLMGPGGMKLISQTGAVFSITVTTAGMANVYRNAGVVTIENLIGGTRTFRVWGFRIRTSG